MTAGEIKSIERVHEFRVLQLVDLWYKVSIKWRNCNITNAISFMGDLKNFYQSPQRLVSYILQQYLQQSLVPVLIVACKVEQKEVQQDHELQPVEFCKKYKLPAPQKFTCLDRINKDIYVKLATLAAFPWVLLLFLLLRESSLTRYSSFWLSLSFACWDVKAFCLGSAKLYWY